MEEWKYIPGYEGLYQASTLGRIRSVDRVIKQNRKNTIYDKRFKGRVLIDIPGPFNTTIVALYKDKRKRIFDKEELLSITFPKRIIQKDGVNNE